MTSVFVIGAIAFGVAMLAFYVLTNASRSSDVERVKNRLLGTPKAAKKKSASNEPRLFADESADTKSRVIATVLKKYNLQDRLAVLLEQAGLKWKPYRLVNTCLAGFIGGYAVAWLFLPDTLRPFALAAAGAGGLLPLWHVYRLKRKRLRAFEELLPDALEFVSRSMRAGHAFSVSLEMIHREFQEPLASEFRRTFEEHNLGLPLDTALQKLSVRVPLLDVQFFVSAVMLQKRTGGNLAEILDKLAYVIRERFKLRGRIRAISAHGRMTGISLTCIPIGVAVMMFFTNPDYVRFFIQDDTGNLMAGFALGLQLLGYLIIKKIVAIEV